MEYRILTVHREWQPRKRNGVIVPHLRMSGKWLREAGFEYGQQVTVEIGHNVLTIRAQTGED